MVTHFLLKKRTNPTPYSPISYFGKEKTPPHNHVHSSFLMKLLKALIPLSHSNNPDTTLKN
jgi:hypothetical protein